MQTDRSEDFPISSLNPLIVTKIVDGKIVHKSYTLKAKYAFDDFIRDNMNFKDEWTLIGSWSGEWSTDVFELDFNVIISKVIEYGRNKFKSFSY